MSIEDGIDFTQGSEFTPDLSDKPFDSDVRHPLGDILEPTIEGMAMLELLKGGKETFVNIKRALGFGNEHEKGK
jgi:hypothetical protein